MNKTESSLPELLIMLTTAQLQMKGKGKESVLAIASSSSSKKTKQKKKKRKVLKAKGGMGKTESKGKEDVGKENCSTARRSGIGRGIAQTTYVA